MLRDAAADIRKYYYNPEKLRALDWDAKVLRAKENIDRADSMDSAVAEIAAALDSLNDSHTRFLPPPRMNSTDYGFTVQMIGDACYVVRVRSGLDAEKKGLKRGDRVVAINGIQVSRKTLWRIVYVYDVLRPQAALRLTLADENGQQRQLDITASTRPGRIVKYFLHQGANEIARDLGNAYHLLEPRYFEKGDDLVVIKIPEFALSAEQVDHLIGRMRAHKAAILDLRANPGGFELTLDRLLGGMFEQDQKIYDRVSRQGTKTVSLTGRHHDAFIGRFSVLIDSQSASASELFARVIQLQHRGFVIGDRSAGRVMEATFHDHDVSVNSGVSYLTAVTVGDLLMSDGKSLEHLGVEPDIAILPTAQDLAARRDPVLAKASAMLGSPLTPEQAGAAFKEEDSSER